MYAAFQTLVPHDGEVSKALKEFSEEEGGNEVVLQVILEPVLRVPLGLMARFRCLLNEDEEGWEDEEEEDEEDEEGLKGRARFGDRLGVR